MLKFTLSIDSLDTPPPPFSSSPSWSPRGVQEEALAGCLGFRCRVVHLAANSLAEVFADMQAVADAVGAGAKGRALVEGDPPPPLPPPHNPNPLPPHLQRAELTHLQRVRPLASGAYGCADK